MEYFSDIDFCIVVHRYFMQGETNFFKPSCHSIELIRSGHVILVHDREKIKLEAPALFWMRAGEYYRFETDGTLKKPCEHLYCDCTGGKADKMVDYLQEHFPAGFLVPADPEKVSSIFFDMVKYYRLGRKENQGELSVNIDLLMLEVAKSLKQPSLPPSDPYGIRLLGDEIRKNPFEKFDFSKIAAKKGITLHHFRRLFRQCHYMPPAEFLREQKMIRASELLRLTDMRIKEIMYNCSFDSEMEFSRTFKRYSGYSPRQYRLLHRKED